MHYKNKSLNNLTYLYKGVTYIEEWRDIIEFEGFYKISSFGRVKSLMRVVEHGRSKVKTFPEKILCLREHTNEYLGISLYKKNKAYNKLVHRLVGEVFINNPQNLPEINHLFGDKKDNFYLNLEWATQSSNILHSYNVLGRRKSQPMVGKTGKLHPNSKPIYCPTLEIGFESSRIAERTLGISQGTISDICNGKQLQRDGLTFKFMI